MPKYLFLLIPFLLSAELYQYTLSSDEQQTDEFYWEQSHCAPFDELLFSWNSARPPRNGGYAIFTSLKHNGVWSEWLYTAEWGDRGQMLYQESPPCAFAVTVRDAVRAKDVLATGFRVQIFSWNCPLAGLRNCFVSIRDSHVPLSSAIPTEPLASVLLPNMPKISQIGLRHPRYLDLSLPVSAAVAVGQITGHTTDATSFCEAVYDNEFDFYESWVFACAEAAARIGDHYEAYVERLPNFQALHAHLLEGFPVLVGVRGYLPGSARPYRFDHMVCIYGYDDTKQVVHAIDPGFPNDRATVTTFPLKEFLGSWSRLENKACIFRKVKQD